MFFAQSAGFMLAVALIVYIPLRQLIDFIFGRDYSHLHAWPKGLCLLVAGMIIWFVGRYMNRASRTNKYAPVHTFLLIKMEYWGFVCAIYAVYQFFIG